MIKKFVVLADTHGTYRDLDTINACVGFAKSFRPDLLIHLGDNWDLAALRKGACEDEQSVPLKPDIRAGEDTLNRFFGSYQPAHKVYLWGNHELARLTRHIRSNNAMVAEYAQQLLDDLTATVNRFTDESRPYCKRNGVFGWEGVNFVHGYAHGMYAPKKHAISYGNSVFGHIHCKSTYTLEDLNQSTSHSVPCACKLDMEYNVSHLVTLRQEQGFAYGFASEELGIFDLFVARKMNDGFYLPTEIDR